MRFSSHGRVLTSVASGTYLAFLGFVVDFVQEPIAAGDVAGFWKVFL